MCKLWMVQEICPKDAVVVTKPFEGEIYLDEDAECKESHVMPVRMFVHAMQ